MVVGDQDVEHVVRYPETTMRRWSASALTSGPDGFYILLWLQNVNRLNLHGKTVLACIIKKHHNFSLCHPGDSAPFGLMQFNKMYMALCQLFSVYSVSLSCIDLWYVYSETSVHYSWRDHMKKKNYKCRKKCVWEKWIEVCVLSMMVVVVVSVSSSFHHHHHISIAF